MQDRSNQRSGAHLPRVQLLQRRAREELPQGGQAARPAAAHHRVRPVRLRARPRAVPVPQQPAEVHRDLRAEGEWVLCVGASAQPAAPKTVCTLQQEWVERRKQTLYLP